jgi:hypothetical protein
VAAERSLFSGLRGCLGEVLSVDYVKVVWAATATLLVMICESHFHASKSSESLNYLNYKHAVI